MVIAQRLYESGYITYMRTDSFNLSQQSLAEAKAWINQELGAAYSSSAPRLFKTKSRLAQEAHEAIRPTRAANRPDTLALGRDEKRLYDLIWRRFIASQLPPAIFDAALAKIEATGQKTYLLKISGSILRFDGWLKLWPTKFSQKELPPLETNEPLKLLKIITEKHYTEPPPRYNEASLIKTLEAHGIGRPSTYAPIISVIQERNYVRKNEQRRFEPTEIGVLVTKILKEHFPQIVEIGFTAKIEEEFDEIAAGKENWRKVVQEFYQPFNENLTKKYEEVAKKDLTETTDIKCDVCGRPMIIKWGRYGKFLACSGYPECQNAKPLKEPPPSIGMKCPNCKEGEVVIRYTKQRRMFYGCSRYPKCDFSSWQNPAASRPQNDQNQGTKRKIRAD
jgi:DNA topoisomerase-1